jgi:hypothetical protein
MTEHPLRPGRKTGSNYGSASDRIRHPGSHPGRLTSFVTAFLIRAECTIDRRKPQVPHHQQSSENREGIRTPANQALAGLVLPENAGIYIFVAPLSVELADNQKERPEPIKPKLARARPILSDLDGNGPADAQRNLRLRKRAGPARLGGRRRTYIPKVNLSNWMRRPNEPTQPAELTFE